VDSQQTLFAFSRVREQFDEGDPHKRYRIAHTIPSLVTMPKWLLDSSSLNEIDHEHHQGNDQEDMNESTHRVRSDQPQRPHDQQNHKNSPKHVSTPFYREVTLSGFLSAQCLSLFLLVNLLCSW
jgi:hypothetical protein